MHIKIIGDSFAAHLRSDLGHNQFHPNVISTWEAVSGQTAERVANQKRGHSGLRADGLIVQLGSNDLCSRGPDEVAVGL